MAGLQADKDILAGLAEAKRDEAEYEKQNIDDSTSQEHELDGIHDGLEFPTKDERHTLRRVSDSIPWSAYRESSPLTVRPMVVLMLVQSDRVLRVGRTVLLLRFHRRLRTSSILVHHTLYLTDC